MVRKRDSEPPPDRSADVAELIRVRRTRRHVPDRAPTSQEKLAGAVGASPNTLGSIELGELRHRDPKVLDAIAKELDMSPGERRSLYLIFNGYEPRAMAGAFPPDCADDHKALIDPLPHHAYVTDNHWNVVAVNGAVRRDVPGFVENINVFEWVLAREESRKTLINWYDVWAVRTLRSLKTYAAVTRDPFLISLYKKLRPFVDRGDDVIGYFEPTGEIRSLIRTDGSTMTFRYQIYRLSSDQPSPYRVVNLIPTIDSPLPVADESHRRKARQLDRMLRGGAWHIPERE